MTKKPKTVWVGSIPVTPISAAEHRRLEKRIKKKHEKLRRRYPEVHGKKVDWISHSYEEGVSADLKGSHCGRFGCEPEMSAMTAGDTGALTAS